MRRAAALDAAAILLFATIGQLSHHGHLSATGYAESALPFLAGWLLVGIAVRGRFLPMWLAGTTLGIAIRMVALSHYRASEAAFWLVALAFLGATTGGWRLVLNLLARRPLPAFAARARRGSPR